MATAALTIACILHFFQHRRVRRMISQQAARAAQMKKQFDSSASGLSEKSREKFRRRIKAAEAGHVQHLGRQWALYVPFLIAASVASSFGFLMWIAMSTDTAAAQPPAAQLPPLRDVSLRSSVQWWYAGASASSLLAASFIVLRLYPPPPPPPPPAAVIKRNNRNMYEIAIAAAYYQIKIPGVTPDRIKLGAVKPTVYDDDFGIVMRLDDRQADLKGARVWVMAVSGAAAVAHLVGCVVYTAALAEARVRFEALLREVAAAEYGSDEGRLSFEALADMYSDFNSRQTFQAYLVPLMLLLLPLLLLLFMYVLLLRKSIPPLKNLVYDKLRKRAADTAQHRGGGADVQQQAVNSAARKKYAIVPFFQCSFVTFEKVPRHQEHGGQTAGCGSVPNRGCVLQGCRVDADCPRPRPARLQRLRPVRQLPEPAASQRHRPAAAAFMGHPLPHHVCTPELRGGRVGASAQQPPRPRRFHPGRHHSAEARSRGCPSQDPPL
jgi:hypothetical protein